MEKMLLGDTGNIKGKHKSAHVSMFPDFDFPCNMSDVANLDSARHPAPRTAIFLCRNFWSAHLQFVCLFAGDLSSEFQGLLEATVGKSRGDSSTGPSFKPCQNTSESFRTSSPLASCMRCRCHSSKR